MRKNGFTLIELLIVITVMATLMTIMFRLGAVSEDQSKKIETVTRLQKLENCLSGYYSAFGSYPPVAVYGSRDIYTEVRNGVQTENHNSELSWTQIEQACRSQPVDCAFPFSEGLRDTCEKFSKEIQEIAKSNEKYQKDPNYPAFSQGFSIGNIGSFTGKLWSETDWRSVQLFRFGLMSYLLPRYLVMMSGDKRYYGAQGSACGQWQKNNDNCVDSSTGRTIDWKTTYQYVERNGDDEKDAGKPKNNSNYVKIANMVSQAVCANWISDLKELCSTCHETLEILGVNIAEPADSIFLTPSKEGSPPELNLYSPGGKGGNWYMLDTITVRDGWDVDFFYYSPLGAQSYILWSSGPNQRTFPPWADKTGIMDRKVSEYGGDSQLTIGDYISDDIVRMNH